MLEPIAITGVGVVSPLGQGTDTLWHNLSNGVSGVSQVDVPVDCRCSIGAMVSDFDETCLTPQESRKYDLFIRYAVQATADAISSSGITTEQLATDRVAVTLGSGIGGIKTIEDNHSKLLQSPRKVSPFFIPGTIINMTSGLIATKFGVKGASLSTVSACSSSAHSVALGAMLIETGQADIVIVGGSEYATNNIGISGFAAMRALSTRNDDPQAASRPWDQDRDGFVIGDGAAVMILESQSSMRKRGAAPHAYLVGYGMTSDGYHITQPSPDGEGAKRAMQQAMVSGRLNPGDIGYVNAHATSTTLGDKAELHAISNTFGHLNHKPKISSTKSMHGHLLGAAGALEALISVLALNNQIVPPTINLVNSEDDYGFDLVPHHAIAHKMSYALSNSFGFGGTNVSLALAHPSAI